MSLATSTAGVWAASLRNDERLAYILALSGAVSSVLALGTLMLGVWELSPYLLRRPAHPQGRDCTPGWRVSAQRREGGRPWVGRWCEGPAEQDRPAEGNGRVADSLGRERPVPS
jgi:hypothetical protein